MTLVYTPVPEILIAEGKKTEMFVYPPVPEGHPRICEPTKRDVIRALLMFDGRHCRRGYQGTWEIKSGRLYLKGLKGRLQLKKGKPILATWFSGALRVPKRPVLKYILTGFAAVHGDEALMAFEKGVVVPADKIDEYETPAIDNSPVIIHGLEEFDFLSRLLRVSNARARPSRKRAQRPKAVTRR